MKNTFSKFLFLLTALAFVGCERDANIDLPETAPKLVMVSFITPQDSFITVSITRSKPIFQSYNVNTSDAVTDATVMLYGNNTSIQIPFDQVRQLYRLSTTQFQVLGGNEYKLTATTPQGETVTATTTVPASAVDNSYSVNWSDSVISAGPNYIYIEGHFTYSFTDNASETNKYRFYVATLLRDSLTGDTSASKMTASLLTDNNANGQVLSRTVEGYWSAYDLSFTDTVYGYDCWMFTVNDDYYNYHQSLYNYNGGGDPFAEPTIIYTNVEGGLGVFAAANGKRIRIIR
jgi:Domain of unknown function (DUF4249)